jgi:hypothetical protein
MPTITLDSLKKTIQDKYGPFEVEFGDGDKLVLTPYLRLSEDRRKQVAAAQKRLSEADAESDDLGELLVDILRAAATEPGAVDRLFEAMGDDRLVGAKEIMDAYGKASQVGEA